MRATAAKNRKAKADQDAQAALEKSARDARAKIHAAGTVAPARNREAAQQLALDVRAAVEKFAAILADRKAVADGLKYLDKYRFAESIADDCPSPGNTSAAWLSR